MERAEELFNRIKKNGMATIDEFILTRKSEELFLDFKRSADNGAGQVLHQNDRNNLAKAISGFGNSEGGIIIWGVDCSSGADCADVARAKVPIQDARRFASWIERAVSGTTIPAHPKVENLCIESGQARQGYIVTLIPKSEIAPHQSVSDRKYYIRSGSNFESTPHAVLAGMFGRRPQPIVFNMYAIPPVKIIENAPDDKFVELSVGLLVANKGPAIARDIYLHVKIVLPGNRCEASFNHMDNNFIGYNLFGMWVSVISKDGFKVAPEAFVQPIILSFRLRPPFEKNLFIEEVLGCEGSPITKIITDQPPEEIKVLYNEFIGTTPDQEESMEFVKKLLKIPDEQIEEQ